MEKWTYYLVLVALVAFCAVVTATPAYSATIYVPSEQPTIQAGVDAAVDGDIACGDINGDGAMDGIPLIDDLVYFATWMFQNGPEPPQMAAANWGGCAGVNVHDLATLVTSMFNCGSYGGRVRADGALRPSPRGWSY